MEYISSPKNDRIKTAKKLTVKKHQKDAGRYLLEGRHLVQEALASGQTPYDIYATEKYVEDRALKPFYDKITQISESVSEHLVSSYCWMRFRTRVTLGPWCELQMQLGFKRWSSVMGQRMRSVQKYYVRCKAVNSMCALSPLN